MALAAGIALAELPDWTDTFKDEYFDDLIEICEELLQPDQLLDLLDADLDFQGAMGLCYSFLIENGEDPEELLIRYAFLIPSD